jgi:quercetin dioxygenase-like cupin family protein
MNTGTSSVISHAIVAAAAAILSVVATWGGVNLVSSSMAQQTALAGAQQLMAQPLLDLPGREVRMTLLDRAPGASSPPHRHPGHHTFGYVIEGSYEFGINGEPPRTLKAGDTFYEPPSALHSTSRNPSADQRLKIVVFMVAIRKTEHRERVSTRIALALSSERAATAIISNRLFRYHPEQGRQRIYAWNGGADDGNQPERCILIYSLRRSEV